MLNLNSAVLMSGADYFHDASPINPHMEGQDQPDITKAKAELKFIKESLESAGVKVTVVAPPKDCQDGIYTANWALCRDNKAVMSRLPNKRKGEETYAQEILRQLGKEVVFVPDDLRFSGQGDALPCGEFLFMGSNYRTDWQCHKFVADTLGYKAISLQTRPKRYWHGLGKRVINPVTGWPDSFYYDIDLAMSILRAPEGDNKGLIAWCPSAFTLSSRKLLREFDDVDKIEVSRAEATQGFACNLVSTGETVVMSAKAPQFQAELEKRGFKVIQVPSTEIIKGGGYIRCTTLTL